ncbi:hypothetical protein [Amycolatopsis japonica]
MSRVAATEPNLHIVVTCANRKRYPVPQNLRMQSLQHKRVAGRFDAWIRQLTTSQAEEVSADQLYGGEHWQVARTLGQDASAAGHAAASWVCSAGYGLVPITAPLRPYAATFSFSHDDSVGSTAESIQSWWGQHADWQGPVAGAPRSLASLATRSPGTNLLIVLSGMYLRACIRDLVLLAERLRHPEQLTIVSVGGSAPRELREFVLPADGHLQTVVGGTLGALNVRIAAKLLRSSSNTSPNRQVFADGLAQLQRQAGQRPVFQRTPMTDDQVRAFILERLTERSTHTALLRQLRSSGLACEQKRFAQLFAATVRSR